MLIILRSQASRWTTPLIAAAASSHWYRHSMNFTNDSAPRALHTCTVMQCAQKAQVGMYLIEAAQAVEAVSALESEIGGDCRMCLKEDQRIPELLLLDEGDGLG